jgi:hypothetical protein
MLMPKWLEMASPEIQEIWEERGMPGSLFNPFVPDAVIRERARGVRTATIHSARIAIRSTSSRELESLEGKWQQFLVRLQPLR